MALPHNGVLMYQTQEDTRVPWILAQFCLATLSPRSLVDSKSILERLTARSGATELASQGSSAIVASADMWLELPGGDSRCGCAF